MQRLVQALAARPYPATSLANDDEDIQPKAREQEPTIREASHGEQQLTRPNADWPMKLSSDQAALLEHLANGQTVAAAAAAERMSLRTANRHLAELRALLGLRSNRELIAAYTRARSSKK